MENAESIHTVAILTTEANDAMGPMHDRMPVLLSPDEEREWLDAPTDRARAMVSPPDGDIDVYAVSETVNTPANDSPAVIEPVEGSLTRSRFHWRDDRAESTDVESLARGISIDTPATTAKSLQWSCGDMNDEGNLRARR